MEDLKTFHLINNLYPKLADGDDINEPTFQNMDTENWFFITKEHKPIDFGPFY